MRRKSPQLLFLYASKPILFVSSRKRALTHIARASERYFSDDPKMIADIEELELEYLFKYAFSHPQLS